ncbi:uncharacterized protein LOC134157283 [Pezoporus occidentalis]|uniref:uncharacterized protein LOC134157283 n=1 Tax=Pezoporus occidentalis TaxID=407982 RepID=UPI002F912B2B
MRGEGVILRREPPFLFARLKPPRQRTELNLWVCGKEFHFIVIVREIFVCLFIWGVAFVCRCPFPPPPPLPPIRDILPPCLPSQGQELTRISTDFNSKLEIRRRKESLKIGRLCKQKLKWPALPSSHPMVGWKTLPCPAVCIAQTVLTSCFQGKERNPNDPNEGFSIEDFCGVIKLNCFCHLIVHPGNTVS